MAHVFVFIEGRRIWMENFLNDLERRRYPYQMMNGQMGMMQPNPREVKLFDISVPEESIPHLMADLSPYANPTSSQRKMGWLIAKVIKLVGRLNPIYGDYKDTHEVRHKWLNIIPIGWKEDPKDPNAKLPGIPKGGELI